MGIEGWASAARHRAGPAGPVATTLRPMLTARFLGGLSIVVDGQVIDTASSRRTRNVLAYLLAHRETPVPRDVLMDVFWRDAEPEAARNSLHVALSGVRRALRAAGPEPLLERWHETYRLSERVDVWVDAEVFERFCRDGHRAEAAGNAPAALRAYERAAQLYEGDFLADDPYAEWAGETREYLRMAAIEAQCRQVALYAARDDHGTASLVARRVLSVDPCNEPVHRQLMLSYARSGQDHLALLQFHRCREALWAAFRIGPAPETVALYESLRDRALRLPAVAAGNVPARGELPRAGAHLERRGARL